MAFFINQIDIYQLLISSVIDYMAVVACVLPLLVMFAAGKTTTTTTSSCLSGSIRVAKNTSCLSWRVAVETGNLLEWSTVPAHCVVHVKDYMLRGQYHRDVRMVVNLIYVYMNTIAPSDDGLDAWILDVDDTCLWNIPYYKQKRYGGEPYDGRDFEAWARRRICLAIPEMVGLFAKLVERGFKVFLLTGRDEKLMLPTVDNLYLQGFTGYEALLMRKPKHKGRSALFFKTEMRRRLVMEEGYRIRGNVGDQWSDLSGNYSGDRIFKIPNPMYFVP